jgi:cytoskeleton protein RodZ
MTKIRPSMPENKEEPKQVQPEPVPVIKEKPAEKPVEKPIATIGQILKNGRISKGLSIAAMAETTKIRARYLEAMEEDKMADVQNRVIVRGFLKIYADRLGLDVKALLVRFDGQNKTEEKATKSLQPAPISANKMELPIPDFLRKIFIKPPIPTLNPHRFTKQHMQYALIGVGCVLLLLMFTQLYFRRAVGTSSKDLPTMENVPTLEPKLTPEEVGSESTVEHFSGVRLNITALGDTWIGVVVDGDNIFKGQVSIGQTKEFEGKKYIKLEAEHPNRLNLTYNGEQIGLLDKEDRPNSKRFYAPILDNEPKTEDLQQKYQSPRTVNTETPTSAPGLQD